MPYPNFAGKHEQEAFFTPQDFLAYARRMRQLPEFSMSEEVIFSYQNDLIRKIAAQEDTEQIAGFGNFHILRNSGGKVGNGILDSRARKSRKAYGHSSRQHVTH